MSGSKIWETIKGLRSEIDAVCRNSERNPEEVSFILVTKTVGLEKIREAYDAGVRDFGENRVQELLEKKDAWPSREAPDVRWHMIGRLQTNKVRQVLPHVTMIHSLDRAELAVEIVRQVRAKKMSGIDCLVQVNSSGEPTKAGFTEKEAEAFVASLRDPEIRLRGLMTIGAHTADSAEIRRGFRVVRELRDRLAERYRNHDWKILSMGMSGDYRIALEEGATLLRIGSKVFGARQAL